MEPQRQINFFHPIRYGQWHISGRLKKDGPPVYAGTTIEIRHPFGRRHVIHNRFVLVVHSPVYDGGVGKRIRNGFNAGEIISIDRIRVVIKACD
jgi:hypothetical protein